MYSKSISVIIHDHTSTETIFIPTNYLTAINFTELLFSEMVIFATIYFVNKICYKEILWFRMNFAKSFLHIKQLDRISSYINVAKMSNFIFNVA